MTFRFSRFSETFFPFPYGSFLSVVDCAPLEANTAVENSRRHTSTTRSTTERDNFFLSVSRGRNIAYVTNALHTLARSVRNRYLGGDDHRDRETSDYVRLPYHEEADMTHVESYEIRWKRLFSRPAHRQVPIDSGKFSPGIGRFTRGPATTAPSTRSVDLGDDLNRRRQRRFPQNDVHRDPFSRAFVEFHGRFAQDPSIATRTNLLCSTRTSLFFSCDRPSNSDIIPRFLSRLASFFPTCSPVGLSRPSFAKETSKNCAGARCYRPLPLARSLLRSLA